MADTKKKKPITLSEEEKAAQRAIKQENDRRQMELIQKRVGRLQSISSLVVLQGSLSVSVPIHASFYSDQDVMLFLRGGIFITRVRKGDLIQLSCGQSPKPGMPCIGIYKNNYVFAVPQDEKGSQYYNLSSHRPEDDIINLNEADYIGNIVYVLPGSIEIKKHSTMVIHSEKQEDSIPDDLQVGNS